MHVCSFCRCRDHKDQVGQRTVKGLVVYALRHYHCRKSRLPYSLDLGMGNSDSFTNSSTPQLLSGKNPFFITCLILQSPSCIHQGDQPVDGLLFGRYRHAQLNALFL